MAHNSNPIFKQYTSPTTDPSQSSSGSLLRQLRRSFTTSGVNPLDAIGHNVNFSMEGYGDEASREVVQNRVEEFGNTAKDIILENQNETGSRYSENQQRAAILGAIAATRPADVNRSLAEQYRSAELNAGSAVNPASSSLVDAGRIAEAASQWSTSQESYDNQENRNSMMLSFTYNLKAARQNEFGEAFFNTVVVSPDVAAVQVEVDLLSVQEDIKRNLDGELNFNFHRKSLVLAMVDHTILTNETTELRPIYRKSRAANVANFTASTDVAPSDITLENKETITTAPLKPDTSIDLIGISQPDYLIKQGQLDFTDQLDTDVRLKAVYIKLANGDVIVHDNLVNIPEAHFTQNVVGRNRSLQLHFDYSFFTMDANSKRIDGADHNKAKPLTSNDVTSNNLKAVYKINLTGTVNTDDGTCMVGSGLIKVEGVYDNNNNKLDTSKGLGKQAVAVFAGATVIGFDLKYRLINTNRRQRGQLLDFNTHSLQYRLPILSPMSIVAPATENDKEYGLRLDKLINATHIRCSNEAVTALLNAESMLSQLPEILEPQQVYSSQALGAARFFVTPYYQHATLDVPKQLQTLRTLNRIEDVSSVLLNQIRQMVFQAYLLSNFKAAREVLLGDKGDEKPLVIIGTDQVIAAYLQFVGDTRSLGDQFNFKVVTTVDLRVRNKIFIAFGKDNATQSDVCNPLHFGNMFWRPEITSVLNISRNNTISKEITTQPSFTFVVHCPVLMTIDVVNLADAITQLSPIVTKTI